MSTQIYNRPSPNVKNNAKQLPLLLKLSERGDTTGETSRTTLHSNSLSLDAVAACGLFMTVGPSLIFLNKHIMTGIGFKFPIMLASIGILRFVRDASELDIY